MEEFQQNKYNRNKLLWKDETSDGVKTGHTSSAGYCLIGSAKRGNMRLITVVAKATQLIIVFQILKDYLNMVLDFMLRKNILM